MNVYLSGVDKNCLLLIGGFTTEDANGFVLWINDNIGTPKVSTDRHYRYIKLQEL